MLRRKRFAFLLPVAVNSPIQMGPSQLSRMCSDATLARSIQI